ncbi:MAG: A/G-specific adenine glycosylase [Actinomycetota bacterium]|nr:A/G-specific adenine glycosylase [Actinomycetota bacterium]
MYVSTDTQRRVLAWYRKHGRSFPWRETRDPYRTLVAEVMLQQTQTGRVGPIYGEFLERFPSIEALARAPAAEVIRAWRGLGYNRRAIALHVAAQIIAREHGGTVPDDPLVLRSLPGVGDYTAHAVACFAYGADVTVADVNVKRVLARAVHGREPRAVAPDKLARTIETWLPRGGAYLWNQALMDVGATLCRSASPLCGTCPMRRSCSWRMKGRTSSTPPRKKGERFEGSRRQARGRVIDHLRLAVEKGITVKDLFTKLHPDGGGDASQFTEILLRLSDEGLLQLTPSARGGHPRGIVRLPVKTR